MAQGDYLTGYRVLIEPLWNWNRLLRGPATFGNRINRTFMELKLGYAVYDDGRKLSINRTFMELKLNYAEYVEAKERY